MICVVDASVAVKWFAEGDWALRENHSAVRSRRGAGHSGPRYFAKAQHLGQIAWLADFSCPQ